MACTDYFKIIIFLGKAIREKWKFYEFFVRGIEKLIRDTNHKPLIPTLEFGLILQ